MQSQKISFKRYAGLVVLAALVSAGTWCFFQNRDKPLAEMVIIIGVDGMSIPGFQKAQTPNMDYLVRNGALSFRTRGVMPTVSGPNWASHLLGAGPEQHGVTFNGWSTDYHFITPTDTDPDGYFPSVFNVVREQMPDAKTGFFYDWDVLIDIFNTKNMDRVEYSDFYTRSFSLAIPWIMEHKPALTFIYIGNPDVVGHTYKWESDEYIRSLEEVDMAIGELMDSLRHANLFDEAHIIIASDHGGIDYGHGGVSMEEIKVPWIISGPGIIKNRMIDQPNDVFNTAATAIKLLGLEQPFAWISRPVYGAIEGTSLAAQNRRSYVPQPFGNISSGIYDHDVKLDLEVFAHGPEIRYTLDGSIPTASSPLWQGPVMLKESTTLNALSFYEGQKSMLTQINYTRVKPVSAIQLTHLPSERYFAEGPGTLINFQKASSSFTDGKWLGFQSDDLIARLTLPENSMISKVSLGYLYTPASWIFEPQYVVIEGSLDGRSWEKLKEMDHDQITASQSTGRNQLDFELDMQNVRYLRATAGNIGVCPPGHPGEGEPAWLFVDEILVK